MVDWAPEAIEDIAEIINYYLLIDRPDLADQVESAILSRAEWIAHNFPLWGARLKGLGSEYGYNLAIKNLYRITYRGLGYDFIKVIMVRHTRRQQPTAQEIKERDQ